MYKSNFSKRKELYRLPLNYFMPPPLPPPLPHTTKCIIDTLFNFPKSNVCFLYTALLSTLHVKENSSAQSFPRRAAPRRPPKLYIECCVQIDVKSFVTHLFNFPNRIFIIFINAVWRNAIYFLHTERKKDSQAICKRLFLKLRCYRTAALSSFDVSLKKEN